MSEIVNQAEVYGQMIAPSVAHRGDTVLIIRVNLTPPDDNGTRIVDWDAAAMMHSDEEEELIVEACRMWLLVREHGIHES